MASLGGIVFIVFFMLALPLVIGDKLREDGTSIAIWLVILAIISMVVWRTWPT